MAHRISFTLQASNRMDGRILFAAESSNMTGCMFQHCMDELKDALLDEINREPNCAAEINIRINSTKWVVTKG